MSSVHPGTSPAGAPDWDRSADDRLLHAYVGPHTVCSGYASPLPQDARALYEVATVDPDHEPECYGHEHDQYLGDDDVDDGLIDVPLGPDTCRHCVREITRLHTQAGAA